VQPIPSRLLTGHQLVAVLAHGLLGQQGQQRQILDTADVPRAKTRGVERRSVVRAAVICGLDDGAQPLVLIRAQVVSGQAFVRHRARHGIAVRRAVTVTLYTPGVGVQHHRLQPDRRPRIDPFHNAHGGSRGATTVPILPTCLAVDERRGRVSSAIRQTGLVLAQHRVADHVPAVSRLGDRPCSVFQTAS